MKLTHIAITSPVFSLARSLEVDLRLGDDSWVKRIEIWQDTDDHTHFRCRFWDIELFRLIPSFPRDAHGQPEHVTDDALLVERGFTGQSVTLQPFHAPDVEAAVAIALHDLKRFLEHATGEAAQ